MSLPKLPLGGWYNKFSYQLLLKLTDMGVGRYVKAWRAEHGLAPMGGGRNMLHTSSGVAVPVLHGFSQYVQPRPQDWPESAYVTGYWFLDHESDWQPSPELAQFLDAGDPPVYVGFGSMAGRNPQRLTRIVVDAIQQAGVRGIIATGWGGMSADNLPETIFKVDNVPHDWLFPRMAAVVHHGGAGTTAAGLLAGRPTVICPFIVDQPYWGARVQALGAGSEPIPQKQLTAEKLAAAIREVTSSASIRQNAESLGEKMRQEDGVATAVEIIERIAAGARSRAAMAG
jgi:sterol 3beta-glucosyltransferase